MGLFVGTRRALLGGGGNPAYVAWFDASKYSGADGDAVGVWPDVSGHGYDAVQSVAGSKFTFKTNIQNGLPGMLLDGGDGLVTPSIDLRYTSGMTLYVVEKRTSGGLKIIVESGDGSGPAGSFIAYVTGGLKFETNAVGNVGTSGFTSTASVDTNPHLLSATIDFSLSTNEATNWIDGTSAGSRGLNSNNTGQFGNLPLNFGARDNAASLQFIGYLFEIRLCGVAHSPEQRGRIEAELRAKWGTP